MNKLKQLLLVAAALICPQLLFAQTKVITGIIKDANEIPLEGVSVKARNSGNITATNKEGVFKIEVSVKDVIYFLFFEK